jgi:putative flippase GtrA
MNGLLNVELRRFLFVGVGANAINYAIYLLVYLNDTPLSVASTSGYVAGLLCSYHFGRTWVFGKKFDISKGNVFGFLAVYAVGGFGMCGLIEFLVSSSLMNYKASWFVGATFAVINNFFGIKNLVFYKGTSK